MKFQGFIVIVQAVALKKDQRLFCLFGLGHIGEGCCDSPLSLSTVACLRRELHRRGGVYLEIRILE